MVKGSDLDIIVVTDNLPAVIAETLDESIYQQKYALLTDSTIQEEIDYIVKDISKVEEQLQFDNFKHMVASKILHEGKYLYGNQNIFDKIKGMLEERYIPQKLLELEKKAIHNRMNAEKYLLMDRKSLSWDEHMKLFCTIEEREEFI